MASKLRFKTATLIYAYFYSIRRVILPKRFLSPGDQYFKNGGNSQLTDFKLSSSALCIDFGGYKGVWAQEIYSKFKCTILIYEPVNIFFVELEEIFADNPKISLFQYGITNSNSKAWLQIDGAASGSYAEAESKVLAEFKDASELQDIRNIDVVKINIEGGEYELIPELYQRGLLSKIATLIIQFHPTRNQDLELCKKLLSQTHNLTWSYDLVWERWDRILNSD